MPDAVHALGVLRPGREPVGEDAVVQISSARLRMLGHSRVGAALAASETLAGPPVRLLLAGTATGHDSADDYERVVRAAAAHAATSTSRSSRSVARSRSPTGSATPGWSPARRCTSGSSPPPTASRGSAWPSRSRPATPGHWDRDMPYEVGFGTLDDAFAAALTVAARPAARAHAERLARLAHETLERLARTIATSQSRSSR